MYPVAIRITSTWKVFEIHDVFQKKNEEYVWPENFLSQKENTLHLKILQQKELES